ncbi:ATP-binding cassette domain-containing protein [Maritimibacter sp. DP07]|uniref:ATP-binding cassette domain-containing protein n=1 Tax=Maritimibacter harenae TaxID=2606218 RepID=A0A845M2G6_9RHOB|nr:ATP-binding cassette domain-containing protein [Maritimibacter harenae]MZR13412.1 ATP-binding cassette domain-containing protein [Maritimibacter harenae]
MSNAQETCLELKDVSKFYPGVKALDGVSFSVLAGEVHGLVGENGAGKSTLMGVASGATLAEEGRVSLLGQDVAGNPELCRKLGLTIVRQEPHLLPDLTVAENIFLALPQDARPPVRKMRDFARDAIASWSEHCDIDVDTRIETLNPEKRFIVEIVKALSGDVRVLVLDEPTEHLVAEDVALLFEKIRALAASGCAIVYISHRIKEVQAIADRLTILRDGQTIDTCDANGLSEADIIEKIVGMPLDEEFPAKVDIEVDAPHVLDVQGLTGRGFHDVSMFVRQGEIVGLAGIDANGQREFLRALAGLNAPSGGQVVIGGKKVSVSSPKAALRAGFSFLPDDRLREGMAPTLSVRENFSIRSIGQNAAGPILHSQREVERAQEAIRAYSVKTPDVETLIGNLSGGNQQKVILASVIARRPSVLLVDEPTQGVDVGARSEIYGILRQIAASGVAVIVLSSDSSELAGLCDRVNVFSRGMILERLDGEGLSDNAITGAILRATSERKRSEKRVSPLVHWAAGDWAPAAIVGVAILLLGIVAVSINPTYLTPRGLAAMMTLVATLAFVSYGQQMLMLVGGIDLSVGPLMGLVGVVGSFFLFDDASTAMQMLGWGAILATAVGVGVLNFALTDIVRLHPLIATLSTYLGLQAVSLLLRPMPGGMTDFDILDGIAARVWFIPIGFLVAVALGLLLERISKGAPTGLRLRAHGSAPEVARVMGVSPRAMRLLAYVGCSMLAGIAGITLIAQVGIGDARAGLGYTLSSIAAAVIGGASLFGGRGSFFGAFLGAVLIVQVNQVASFIRLDSAWSSYLLGVMILASVALYSFSRKRVLAS